MRWKRSKTCPNFERGGKEGWGSKGGTGWDPGRGWFLGRDIRVAPSLWSCPPDSRAVPSAQRPFPPDPALTRQGLGQDQGPQEQHEGGSRPHDSHPLGLGRSRVWAGGWRLYNSDPLIGFSRNRAPSGSENRGRITSVQAAGLNTGCERESETRGEGESPTWSFSAPNTALDPEILSCSPSRHLGLCPNPSPPAR